MIYFDNAATTYPKPMAVTNAVRTALQKYGANPGRSGHKMSMAAAEEEYRCRVAAANLFHAEGPENVAFTLNCTHAINIVLKGLLKPGDHVVVSCLEHNAFMRPLEALRQQGVSYTQAQVVPGDSDATLDGFRKALNAKTKLIVCMHASNVWGIRLPIERISAMGKEYGIPILVDAAQTAGILPIDVQDSRIDYLCAAGHKGLYGPMGTGLLITPNGDKLSTIIEGGTGTSSISLIQPGTMPDRMESGTPNMPGIAGLRAGIEYVSKIKPETIAKHEQRLMLRLYDKLSSIKKVKLFMPRPEFPAFVPLLSFNIADMPSEEAAAQLNQHQIFVRAGIHCAPEAHKFAGTLETGAVRVCPSVFSKEQEIDFLVNVVGKIAKK